jgi:biotin operon repressor
MGRNEKKECTKENVYDHLGDKKWHTTAEMAQEFSVSLPTVGSRIKKIVKDGVGILAGPNGYKRVEKEDVDEEVARDILKMMRRMVTIIMRQAMVAKPMKVLAKEAVKLLPKNPEERAIVRKYLVQLTHLIDFQELEDIE